MENSRKRDAALGDALTSRARRGLWALGSAQAALQAISWVLTLVTVRFLSPSDYGLMSLAETFVPYLSLVATLNLVTFLVQEKALEDKDIEGLFTFGLLLGGSVTLLAACASPFISRFYQNPQLTIPLLLISLMFFVRSVGTVPEGLLKRKLEFKQIAYMNFSVGVSRGVLQLVLAYFGCGYWALVIGFIYRDILNTLWFLYARPFPKTCRLEKDTIRRAVSFGLPATGAAALWIVYSTADNIVVGKLLGAEVLGLYAMAFYLIDLPLSKLNTVLRPVLIPYYSRLREHPEQLCRAFLQTVSAFSIVTFPLISGLGLVAEEGVALLLGAKWQGLILPLQCMAAVGVLRATTTNTSPLFLALGKPKLELVSNLFGAILLPPAFFFAAKHYGLFGIYGCWFFFLPCIAVLVLILLRRTTGITICEYLRTLVPAMVATIAMITVTLLTGATLHASAVFILGVKIVCGATCYVSVIVLFHGKAAAKHLLAMGMLDER